MEPPPGDDEEPVPPPRRRPSNGGAAPSPPSSWLETRLFYVRISPCSSDAVPPHLILSHLRREIGSALDINGARVPSSDPTSVPLRRDRVDSSEVTYVSTDAVRLTGAVEFEVLDDRENLILCGTIEHISSSWINGAILHQGLADKELKTGWSLDCYSAASIGSSAFVQPKLGISSPSIEVYVAGCFAGSPLILSQTVQLSPRRKTANPGNLDAIPEEEDTPRSGKMGREGLHHRRASLSSSVAEGEIEEYGPDMKVGHTYYPEGWYTDENGQLTWFNAGVRVGVGIGLGMCLGIGIGVGLLMRSYQATTRSFRRRFF